MLRVSALKDRFGTYYLASFAAERSPEELAGGHAPRAPGRWAGRGSAGLGLRGDVCAGALAAVLDGRDPANERRLRSRAGSTAGFDLTFAVPKSVSVLFALGDRRTSRSVIDVHDAAVAAGLAYVASHGASVRRGAEDARAVLPVDGLVAATFTHASSRAGDPHLHTHVVVANLVHGADGRWSALDGRGIAAHARAAGALYDAVLRRGIVRATGMEWTRRPGGTLELGIVDTVVVGAFSGRRAEILQHAGVDASPRARRVAWAATREPKLPRAPDVESLRATWGRRADDAGLAPTTVVEALEDARARRAEHASRGPDALDERHFATGIGGTFHGGVTRRQVLFAWAAALDQGAGPYAIERCVEEVGPWGPDVGVAERQRPPRHVVPSAQVLHLLGPRPCDPDRLRTWLGAAAAVERYCDRWPTTEPHQTLGAACDPVHAARLSPAQLAASLKAARAVDDALVRLGRARHATRRPGRAHERSDVGISTDPGADRVTLERGWMGR